MPTHVQLVLNHVVEGVLDASSITTKAHEHAGVATELGSGLDLSQGTAGDLFVSPAGTEIMAEVRTPHCISCLLCIPQNRVSWFWEFCMHSMLR